MCNKFHTNQVTRMGFLTGKFHISDHTLDILPVVHVIGHVFNDIMIQVVRTQPVWEGSWLHGFVIAVCDPGVFHHLSQAYPALWICSQELFQQVNTL